MKLGISTCTYTWNFGVKNYPMPKQPFNVDTLLENAVKLNVSVVQILDNIVPLYSYSDESLKQMGEKAKKLNITLEIGTLGITPTHFEKYLKIANLMGATLVRTIMDGDGQHPTVAQGAKWIKEILPEYHTSNVSIAIENHDLRKAQELKDLMELVNDTSVGICLDMVNSLGAQECQRQVVDMLLPFVTNVHYKDFKIKRIDSEMGFTVMGCIAGQGMTDMDYIINNCNIAKGDFNIILEQWMPWLNEIEFTASEERRWADESISYMQSRFFKK